VLCLWGDIDFSYSEVKQFTINFRTESKVVGPSVLLGEISQIVIKDEKLKKKLAHLVITKAAPPGEAREITKSMIKKRIQASGFDLNQIILNGPNTMRVTTIQNKIIHLKLNDPIGAVFDLNFFPDMGNASAWGLNTNRLGEFRGHHRVDLSWDNFRVRV
ncbi:hypothetical protein JW964_17150, partial [candidate division KSB1 bacterium]|nr:hypothetical protein [candidate division KSB1 bacterium]